MSQTSDTTQSDDANKQMALKAVAIGAKAAGLGIKGGVAAMKGVSSTMGGVSNAANAMRDPDQPMVVGDDATEEEQAAANKQKVLRGVAVGAKAADLGIRGGITAMKAVSSTMDGVANTANAARTLNDPPPKEKSKKFSLFGRK